MLVTNMALYIIASANQWSMGRSKWAFPRELVLHGCRYTFLTRSGEARANAFTIMKLVGHSSFTVSQQYAHPTAESCELAFERLEALNSASLARIEGTKNNASLQKSLQPIVDSA